MSWPEMCAPTTPTPMSSSGSNRCRSPLRRRIGDRVRPRPSFCRREPLARQASPGRRTSGDERVGLGHPRRWSAAGLGAWFGAQQRGAHLRSPGPTWPRRPWVRAYPEPHARGVDRAAVTDPFEGSIAASRHGQEVIAGGLAKRIGCGGSQAARPHRQIARSPTSTTRPLSATQLTAQAQPPTPRSGPSHRSCRQDPRPTPDHAACGRAHVRRRRRRRRRAENPCRPIQEAAAWLRPLPFGQILRSACAVRGAARYGGERPER